MLSGLTGKMWAAVAGAGILIAGFLAMLGTYYAYGQRQYAAGQAAERAAQVQASDNLGNRLREYADRAQAAEEAAATARAALAAAAQATAESPSPRPVGAPEAGCDYSDALWGQINAIKLGK